MSQVSLCLSSLAHSQSTHSRPVFLIGLFQTPRVFLVPRMLQRSIGSWEPSGQGCWDGYLSPLLYNNDFEEVLDLRQYNSTIPPTSGIVCEEKSSTNSFSTKCKRVHWSWRLNFELGDHVCVVPGFWKWTVHQWSWWMNWLSSALTEGQGCEVLYNLDGTQCYPRWSRGEGHPASQHWHAQHPHPLMPVDVMSHNTRAVQQLVQE
jgi:hypothetical protein